MAVEPAVSAAPLMAVSALAYGDPIPGFCPLIVFGPRTESVAEAGAGWNRGLR
jgi:hypothetical protein